MTSRSGGDGQGAGVGEGLGGVVWWCWGGVVVLSGVYCYIRLLLGSWLDGSALTPDRLWDPPSRSGEASYMASCRAGWPGAFKAWIQERRQSAEEQGR